MIELYSINDKDKLNKKIKKDFIIFLIFSFIYLALVFLIIFFETRENRIIFLIISTLLSFIFFSYVFYYFSYTRNKDKRLLVNINKALNSEGVMYTGEVTNIISSSSIDFETYDIDVMIDDKLHTFKSLYNIDALNKKINIYVVSGFIKKYEIL